MSNILGTLWSDMTTYAGDVWTFLENLFSSTVSSEVAALAPIAEAALAELGIDLTTVTTLSGAATVIGQVVTATASKAEAAALQAGASSLITAVGGALANAQAAVATPAPAAPTS